MVLNASMRTMLMNFALHQLITALRGLMLALMDSLRGLLLMLIGPGMMIGRHSSRKDVGFGWRDTLGSLLSLLMLMLLHTP